MTMREMIMLGAIMIAILTGGGAFLGMMSNTKQYPFTYLGMLLACVALDVVVLYMLTIAKLTAKWLNP